MNAADSWSFCLAPLTKEEFFNTVLGRRPVHIRRQQPDRFAGMLELAEIDRILSSGLLTPPWIKVWKKGRRVPSEQLVQARRSSTSTREHALDVRRVYDELHGGSVLTLQNIHDYVPRVRELCGLLQADLGHLVESHAVLTLQRDANVPTPKHSDPQDNLVLQLAGQKRWRVQDRPPELLPSPFIATGAVQEAANMTFTDYTVAAGDTLYIPRGCAHEVQLDGDLSLHITINLCWTTLLEGLRALTSDALDRLAERPDFQRRLAADCAVDGAVGRSEQLAEGARQLFEEVRRLDASRALERVASTRSRFSRPSVVALAALNALGLEDRVERTEMVPHILTYPDGSVGVRVREETLHLPDWLAVELQSLVSQAGSFRPAELPRACDDGELLMLVKSLLLLNVLRIANEVS